MADKTYSPVGSGRTGWIQYWQVPLSGDYRITAYGAQGGRDSGGGGQPGGKGAKISGVFSLTEGDVVGVLVGHQGGDGDGIGGGGGASHVALLTGSSTFDELVSAGGGGGGGFAAGGDGEATLAALGDDGGGSGSAGGNSAGFRGNGTGGQIDATAYGFVNGGTGSAGSGGGGDGGFGGGAGSESDGGGVSSGDDGGAGGGYKGRNGVNNGVAPGGISFNGGAQQTGTAGLQEGSGLVEIDFLDEGELPTEQVFLTPGQSEWTVPSGAYDIEAVVIGGGGGASGCPGSSGMSGAGGGGGANAWLTNLSLFAGDTLQIQVGAGGTGGSAGENNVVAGGDSWIEHEGVKLLHAGGGSGGVWGDTVGADGGAVIVGNGGAGGLGGGSRDNSGGGGGGGAGGAGGPGGDGGVGNTGTGSSGTGGGGGGGGGQETAGQPNNGGGGSGLLTVVPSWGGAGGGVDSPGRPGAGGASGGDSGGLYGGGGGGAEDDSIQTGGSGGDGAVLIRYKLSMATLDITPQWQSGAYELSALWSVEEGATGYRLTLLQGEAQLGEIDTTNLSHTFAGLAPDTTYTVEMTPYDDQGDLTMRSAQATTGPGLPGAITGLGYTFTTTSLDFTWDAASDAVGYLATLYRDGNQVEQQDVATEAASFTGLEDGTAYTLDLHAYNVQGDGPVITGYDATTAYAIPSPPINLRQFEERIIAVICRWDLVEPAKTFDVQLQLLYGNELLFDEVVEPEQTERTFNVPMASTDYLLRVRAGNSAGWSEWAEGTVSSETFPLIDSRLGVMAATYQEDALYTDTWDGASDQPKGTVEQLSAEAVVEIDGYNLVQTYSLPVVHRRFFDEAFGLAPALAGTFIDLRNIRRTHDFSEAFGLAPTVAAGTIYIEVKRFLQATNDTFGAAPALDGATIDTTVKRFLHIASDSFGVAPSLSSATIDTVVP